MADDPVKMPGMAEQLAQLRKEYLARLPAELASLQSLTAGLSGSEADRPSLDKLYQRLHKLAGSGGTFGLAALSTRAHVLEHEIKSWLEGSLDDMSVEPRLTITTSLASLTKVIVGTDTPTTLISPPATALESGSSLLVWLAEDDELLGRQLAIQIESFNYEVRLFTRINEAEHAAQSGRPDMLIMDVIFEEEGENSTDFLTHHPNLRQTGCPLLFISSFDDFQSRIRAAQLEAEGYFLKPLDVPRLVSRMVQIADRRRAPPQRVLIVDDDEDLSEHYRLILLGAGIEAEVLHDPESIAEKLSTFRPELLLMDMNMPNFSGQDLAAVVRQYEAWASLPIVYLSAETDLARQIKALDRGADDFLTKPISDAQLVSAVRVRIERGRQLAAQITKDSLTGLLRHASIKEAAETETVRSRRSGKPITVAMLDIDHFKNVNDTHGHAAGDVVISSIAMLLRQRLRQTDIIGRYGGEEFVALLVECDIDASRRLMEDIRQRFSALHFSHAGKEFSCTLSAGLACSAQHVESSDAELLIYADEALYAAKRGGRNQIQVNE